MHRPYLAVILLSILSVSYTSTLQHPFDALFLATQPVSMGLDVDSYPPSPSGLSLEQVHIYIRHGERAPVGIRMPKYIPENWFLCNTGRQFSANVWDQETGSFKQQSLATLTVRRVLERRDGTSSPGECMLGELTDIGRESTYAYGVALRRLYIDKLSFLPDTVTSNAIHYYRSTNMPRTIESLQQIMHGLYPTSKYTQGLTPQLLVRNAKDENLNANQFACKRLERMNMAFAQAAADALNPTLATLDRRLSKFIDGNPIRIDGKPRASGILDTIKAAKAHGFRIPREFDEEAINLIEYAVVNEWFSGYKNQEFRRLAMGPLLHDLQKKLARKASLGPKDPSKILIHSTHDTALAGISSALDVFDNRWPTFTASITFELFKDSLQPTQGFLSGLRQTFLPSERPRHYVRMRYQNKDMAIPYCTLEGNHLPGAPEFCTLKAFQERIRELTPEDWDAECVPQGRNITIS